MGWRDYIKDEPDRLVLPWTGGRTVYDHSREWSIEGALPPEHGWYTFLISGSRKTRIAGPAEIEAGFGGRNPTVKGYIVGERLIPDDARVDPDPAKLIHQTQMVHLVEPGLERFSRAMVAKVGDHGSTLIYIGQEFPQGAETEVLHAFEDRASTVDGIKGVTPALDLAFRYLTWERAEQERQEIERQRRADEEERQRVEEEKRQELVKSIGSAVGRRAVAARDFNTAAKYALAMTGAEFLDARPHTRRNEMVVRYRLKGRRFECVCNKLTLRIVEAGICLTDHDTGKAWDDTYSLETLPAVVATAIADGVLHVWRNVD